MKAVVALVTILTLTVPQLWRTSLSVSTRDESSVTLAAPAAVFSHIGRDSAATDKSSEVCWAIRPDETSRPVSATAFSRAIGVVGDHPNIDLHEPPLAPRPPPAV